MPEELNKLQIRAKILSILSELKLSKTLSPAIFSEKIAPLKDITDKEALFEILVREMNKAKDTYLILLKAALVESIPIDILKEKILDMLNNSKLSDQAKYQLIQVLKDIGTPIEYDQFFNYFDDPDSVLDYDTQKLLEFAMINPETQIDFLDFLYSLPLEDQLMLINSLNDDYEGDNLANVLCPVLYADFPDEVIERVLEILGETKSSIPLESIEFFKTRTSNEKMIAACNKNLKLLKIAGATPEKAQHFYKILLSNSKIDKCYTTLPDGHNNQGFVIIRKRENETKQMFAVVINYQYGIMDCFGFNFLTDPELYRIIDKFGQGGAKVEVSPQYCKSVINQAINKTKEIGENYSYEFVCWNVLLKDIQPLDYSVSEYIESNIEAKKLTDDKYKTLYEANYFDKWFFTASDNQAYSTLIDEFFLNNELTLDCIDKSLFDSFDKIWTEEERNNLNNRIISTVYLINLTDKADDALLLKSLLNDDNKKQDLMNNILKKSVYETFFLAKQNLKDSLFSTNIFKLKKNQNNQKINLKKIEEIIKAIETKWVN